MRATPPLRTSPPATRKAIPTHTSEETRPPKRASTATPSDPSAFIATADHSPFSSGQVIVCVPAPLAWTRQKSWPAGGAGSAHTGGVDARPAEYEQRVVAFFDEALLDNN